MSNREVVHEGADRLPERLGGHPQLGAQTLLERSGSAA